MSERQPTSAADAEAIRVEVEVHGGWDEVVRAADYAVLLADLLQEVNGSTDE